MTRPRTPSRRDALKGLIGFGTAAPLVLNLSAVGAAAAAENPTDYKAIVCLFLVGGNDANNLLVATDDASWQRYWSARFRGATPIALMPPGTAPTPIGSVNAVSKRTVSATNFPEYWGGVLPITPKTPQRAAGAAPGAPARTFGLHPLMPNMQKAFNAGRLAALANVGTLVAPLTKAQYQKPTAGVQIPPRLFSHNDQQQTWQTGQVGYGALGYGGQMGDVFAASSSGAASINFTAFTTAGLTGFPVGAQVKAYRISVGPTGGSAVRVDLLQKTGSYNNSPTFLSALSATLLGNDAEGSVLGQAYADAMVTSNNTAAAFSTALASSPVSAPPAFTNPLTGATQTNSLADQLRAVAQTIVAHGTLGPKRQVFFVQIGSFDTHDGQNDRQSLLLAQVDHALAYFDAEMTAKGYGEAVTTFTASDFSRTFTTNGDGTDHAWGAHHLILGGAVKGGDIYGQFPTVGVDDAATGFNNPDMSGTALIPTTSVDQYMATLAKWFGVPSDNLAKIIPRLPAFATPDLGFMTSV
ncbi:DUF1501 domain-containing protein [Caulobacter vibrioides]|uniref:DUF1501 domain-containing protein n=1 Tax=Caulobacter vibrioides TaxID=155892 RepID=UPI000BB496E5|nr:DUF1501 domain-containing protein [Caulobacter vibrioides]ATC25406.1 DUF1501 domain-containing protein [Caulobacter vibrioides]AZH13498.1 DUF1501 domain-containing protein [Caulobacter vibrioides]PLR14365.1 DUF1501 domain-containing protein [Caulobacter vibrioides]